MSLADFAGILGKLPAGHHVVCLQGEGEPLVHPDFWAMVDRVRASGHTPYTITNGSRVDAAQIAAAFPRIAVSLDTVDTAEADRIGRKKLPKVLHNIDRLLEHMGPQRVAIATVDYGQPLDELRAYVRSKGIADHMVQPLQVKEDYRKRYPDFPVPVGRYTYQCRYLEQPLHRTYDLDRHVLPCCYIKDPAGFVSIDALRASLRRREVPQCCRGCREILEDAKQPCWISNPAPPPPVIDCDCPDHGVDERAHRHVMADECLALRIDGMYLQIKTDIARALGVDSLPGVELQRIYAEVKRAMLGAPAAAAEVRISLPAPAQFPQPPGWRLKREWIYRFEPDTVAPPSTLPAR